MEKIGLVVEGGGLRGLYTCGVLDAFLDIGVEFPACYGVSAGVCNAVSYIAGQKGRNYNINMKYIDDKRYLSIQNLIKTGSIFGTEMILHLIPEVLEPFDYEAYEQSGCVLTAGVTNCATGQPEYFTLKSLKSKYPILEATTALPFVSKIVEYQGKPYLDGGLTDAIPVKKSMADGFEKNVCVLTRHKEYRKKPSKVGKLVNLQYKGYDKLRHVLENRHEMYNDTLQEIDQLEQSGQVFVIRPQVPLNLGRFERNREKLKWAYELGRADTFKCMNDLKAFLMK